MEPRLKNLIILGAGLGHDIDHFKRKIIPNERDWNIYAFEPGLDQYLHLQHRFRNFNYIHCFNAAATTFEGMVNLYDCPSGNNGRSINSSKINVCDKFKEVEAVDIVKWLKENINPNDYTIAVIDIEGAEYDVIDALERNNMLNWFNKLYIEFHGVKLTGFDMSREKSMIDMLIDFYKENVYIENYYQSDKFSEMNSEVQRVLNGGTRD
jgi:FkbM family methyltransferase